MINSFNKENIPASDIYAEKTNLYTDPNQLAVVSYKCVLGCFLWNNTNVYKCWFFSLSHQHVFCKSNSY